MKTTTNCPPVCITSTNSEVFYERRWNLENRHLSDAAGRRRQSPRGGCEAIGAGSSCPDWETIVNHTPKAIEDRDRLEENFRFGPFVAPDDIDREAQPGIESVVASAAGASVFPVRQVVEHGSAADPFRMISRCRRS